MLQLFETSAEFSFVSTLPLKIYLFSLRHKTLHCKSVHRQRNMSSCFWGQGSLKVCPLCCNADHYPAMLKLTQKNQPRIRTLCSEIQTRIRRPNCRRKRTLTQTVDYPCYCHSMAHINNGEVHGENKCVAQKSFFVPPVDVPTEVRCYGVSFNNQYSSTNFE